MERIFRIVYTFLLLIVLSTIYFAQDDMFDSTFSLDGIELSDFGSTFEKSQSMLIMPNGNIVVAGYSSEPTGDPDIALVRYNSNGTFDDSFGVDGLVLTDLNNSNDYANKIAVQKDNKLLVTGFSYNNISRSKAIVLRYNIDGTLDTTFSNDGIFEFGLNQYDLVGNSIRIQDDQRILVVGTIKNGTGISDVLLFRLNSLGHLDTTFNNKGYIITDVLEGFDKGNDVVINSINKILVIGLLDRKIGLIQYNSDGTIDSSFSQDGISTVTTSNFDEIYMGYGLALQADGKIIIVGDATYDFSSDSKILIIRLNEDGSLDNYFSEDGIVKIDFNEFDRGTCIALQSDKKIIIAGNAGDDFAVLRLNTDGSLDNTFWGNGKMSIGFSNKDYGRSLELQLDGKIVISGYSFNGIDWDFSTIRLNNPNYITNVNSPIQKINEFSLSQNYPNPFNPSTKIRYSIPKSGSVKVYLYDILGNEVVKFVDKINAVGNYEIEFNAEGLSNGIYFYRINSGNYSNTKKMIVLK